MRRNSANHLLGTILITLIYISIIIALLGYIGSTLNILKFDFSNTEADVKILEVGTHYAFLNLGEQKYIRIQNAYSSQFSSGSEVWETTISPSDYQWFKDAQASNSIVHIGVDGYGVTTVFTSITGDRVISKELKQIGS